MMLIAIIMAISLLSGFVVANKSSTGEGNELTLMNVYNELCRLDVKDKNIVMAQVRLETGHLKKISHKNNLFGFKGLNGKYRTYPTWQTSVEAFKVWQDKYFVSGSYIDFIIKKKYADNMHAYIINLKKIMKKYNKVNESYELIN
jgi:uncharacterized FlgJ-related protein